MSDERRQEEKGSLLHSSLITRHSSLLLWLCGMLLAFYPVLFSGFARVSGDLGDSRLLNYLLEHDYRWLLRQPAHRDLWSPPFFYPEANVGAYSDILLSAGPCYWPWRLLG